MKSSSNPSPEYKKFDAAMRHVRTVSKEELQRRIEEDKQAHAGRPKRGPKPKTRLRTTRLPKGIRRSLDCPLFRSLRRR